MPLRDVAAFLEIDQAILSKIERGQRKANRLLVNKLAEYFRLNSDELLILWLSDKLLYELKDESEIGIKALQMAEEKIAYQCFLKIDRNKIVSRIQKIIENFRSIKKIWVFGSFARGDDKPESDIDLAIETDREFSYFDLEELRHRIEEMALRKVDIGFIDSFKPEILENIKPDLKLIYER